MNRRNFLKLAAAAFAAKALPVRALSAVAPELVAIEPHIDMLGINKWGRVETKRAPEWFEPAGSLIYGMPYWMVAPPYIADTYAGIPRTRLP
jgi:hypothetical protein